MSFLIPLNTALHFDITLYNASGTSVLADETPKFYVFENATDAPLINGSGLAQRVGWPIYRGRIEVNTANSFVAGRAYNVDVSGRVNNIPAFYNKMTFIAGPTINCNLLSVSGQNVTLEDFKNNVTLGSGSNVYFSRIKLIKDTLSTQDDYLCTWYRSGTVLPSSVIFSPTLQVFDPANGNSLIPATGMSFISGSIGTVKYTESASANRTTGGNPYLAQTVATIDGASRTWVELVGRDS